MIYHLDLTYHCADDGQAERVGVAMAEFISAEFDVTGYGISRVVPIGPPAACTCWARTEDDGAHWPNCPRRHRADTGDEGEGT